MNFFLVLIWIAWKSCLISELEVCQSISKNEYLMFLPHILTKRNSGFNAWFPFALRYVLVQYFNLRKLLFLPCASFLRRKFFFLMPTCTRCFWRFLFVYVPKDIDNRISFLISLGSEPNQGFLRLEQCQGKVL